ncbi:MAG TPA: DUF6155 family protein [Bacteroidia bacterium]|jgi:hypothetical protein|nr:DUF6155 family protein [Bacteroidia bacterium]
MTKLTKKALLKHLQKSDKEDIINEVVTLFDKFKNVKEFYNAELSGEENPLLDKYKKKISLAYSLPNPKERSTNINLNRLINEFKKVSIYERELADLMLHRVECGIEAYTRRPRRTATFYNCIVSTFEDAIKLIVSGDYLDEFNPRINEIINNSQEGKYAARERMADIFNKFS